MSVAAEIRLSKITATGSRLAIEVEICGQPYLTSYWYDSADFDALREQYSQQFIERVLFHIAAFEINKYCSTGLKQVDFGPYGQHATEHFIEFWQLIFHKVWAQWRYENNKPNFAPTIVHAPAGSRTQPISHISDECQKTLAFCGGGKDSFVAMRILQEAEIPFDTLGYSSSIYGVSRTQHDLIERLSQTSVSEKHHKQWIFDDFLDSPILDLSRSSERHTLTAAETPSSVFASLPIVLSNGFRYIALGHELSADTGQVYWEKTQEDVNHQWGKSLEAERLINDYIQSYLIQTFDYFSILKPIYDVVIFSKLAAHPECAPATHSCNVRKPWCNRCPKCLYVFLNYAAYLPKRTVLDIFGENLFSLDCNLFIFCQLIGCEKQLPFECIGQADEARLAFELALRRGWQGAAIETYRSLCRVTSITPLAEKYCRSYADATALPDGVRDRLLPIYERLASESYTKLTEVADSCQ